MEGSRAHWGSRLAFVLAAAGSAIGLGNIWRFPYQAGENGGGVFVVVYLLCVVLIGLPVMIAEVLIGRSAQNSPVGAFRALSRVKSPWMSFGWLGVVVAFLLLSYYSVVGGWVLHYVWICLTEGFTAQSPEQIEALFGEVTGDPALATFWHVVFMVMTIVIVAAGVEEGIERYVRFLMPLLFLIMLVLLGYAVLGTGAFGEGAAFLLQPDFSKFSGGSLLAALGQGFFTLSLGMGAMLTYGSYLESDSDLVTTAVEVTVLNTVISLLAGLILFPIVFGAGLDPNQGPGFVFKTVPIAFSEMPGGLILAPIFFLLLAFAALTSAISLMEVATSYFIDEKKWPRRRAAWGAGMAILLLGIPSAISWSSPLFGEGFKQVTAHLFGDGAGMNWFGFLDTLVANWLLAIGALGVAMFVAWGVGGAARETGFKTGSRWGNLYLIWLYLLRYLVPIAVAVILLDSAGVW